MTDTGNDDWSSRLFEQLVQGGVKLFAHVPDAGIAGLIRLAEQHNEVRSVLLASEQEGVAICAGADLVGGRGVLLMQSSGVGNCPNVLSLVKGGGFPILMVISMRGDYGEQNPWQYPMGQAVEPVLQAMGVLIHRVDAPDDLAVAAAAALSASSKGGQSAALILSQRFLGAKAF
jgi:sulfopyruvate decarboxylase alpha subunit